MNYKLSPQTSKKTPHLGFNNKYQHTANTPTDRARWSHKYTSTDSHLTTHRISTRRTVQHRTQQRILTPGFSPPRTQLARPNRHQIHHTVVHRRTTPIQSHIHQQETRTKPSRPTLALNGQGDRDRSRTRPNGRPIPWPILVAYSHHSTNRIPTHLTTIDTTSPRPHHCHGLQHRTNRIRWETENTSGWRLETIRPQPSLPYDRPALPPYTGPLHMARPIHQQTWISTAPCMGPRPRWSLPPTASRWPIRCLCVTTHTRRSDTLAPSRPTLWIGS